MNVLFAHDHKFSVDEKGNVYSYLMDAELWKRYLPFFNKVHVVSRKINVCSTNPKQISGMKPAHADGVSFTLFGHKTDANGNITKTGQIEKYNTVKKLVSNCDCVIARLPSIIGYMACRQAIKQKKKYAVEVVACAWDSNWYHGNKINKSLALASLLVMKHYVKHADHAIYVTDSFLQKRYPCKGICSVASNVNIDIPEPDILNNRIKRILKHKNKIVFGLVGPLHVKFKGHETAILALSLAKDKIPPFELRCIGSGDPSRWYKLAGKTGIGGNVYFDGLLKSGKPVEQWMDNIDILLIPSLQEGLPRALIEAMSRGIPSLGAVTGGIPQLLDEKYLHKKKDYKKLAKDIIQLSNDAEEMLKCARQNQSASMKYTKPVLNKQRSAFWDSFSKSI